MDSKQKKLCHGIIHSASVAAAGVGAGLAQIPGSDNAVITPIQLGMTISLGKVFGITINDSAALSAIASASAACIGRAASQFLVGWLPVAGNIINAATAASITETMGWLLANEFFEQSIAGVQYIEA